MSKQLQIVSGANILGGTGTDMLDIKSCSQNPQRDPGDIRLANNNGTLNISVPDGAGAIRCS